jgi:hypothetical protein
MRLAFLLTSALALLQPAVAFAGDVQLEIRDGRVWISATDASVGQILAAWARVGRTTILNAEKVLGPLVTLEVSDMPEREALDLVLRSASGYVATPRSAAEPDGSAFARILILATSTAAAPQPGQAILPLPTYVSEESESEPPAPPTGVERLIGPDGQPVPDDQDGAPSPVQRMPKGYSSGDPAPDNPQSPPVSPAPGGKTVMPGGVAVPGMIVPPRPDSAQTPRE